MINEMIIVQSNFDPRIRMDLSEDLINKRNWIENWENKMINI